MCEYLKTNGDDIAWDFIRSSMESVAGTSIIMMQVCRLLDITLFTLACANDSSFPITLLASPPQDVMRLDNTARMNTPGRAENNWMWRMGDSSVWQLLVHEAKDLRKLAGFSNRLPPGSDFKV